MENEPYLTVGTDDRGSACWIVVGLGCRIYCTTGQRALEILASLARSAGTETPIH